MSKGIHKHAISDPKPDITKEESLDDYRAAWVATWPETDADAEDYSDWQYEVGNGDTVLGFRDWTAHRDEADQ